ncbi:MAG: CBASS cGAMP-activated phospholipase, partial [Planctomycetota bacterium]
MPKFQILSLIGGGIRGAFVTAFLKELESKLGRPLAECFDLIAGTSTGGIIAGGLALGLSADQMHDFYVRYGRSIFTPRPKFKPNGYLRLLFPTASWLYRRKTGNQLDSFLRARYCPDALYQSFAEGMGEKTLADVNFTRLIIPSVNLTRGRPHIFRSTHIQEAVEDSDIKLSDVLVAATAAPTYFPHKEIKNEAYADGGLWASDPSIHAVAEAMRIRRDCRRDNCDPEFEIEDIHLLSIGTGRAKFSLSPPGGDAGLIYWAQHVADVMGTSQVQGVHQPLKFWLEDRYTHVNFEMEASWPLDATDNIPRLFEMGEKKADDWYNNL